MNRKRAIFAGGITLLSAVVLMALIGRNKSSSTTGEATMHGSESEEAAVAQAVESKPLTSSEGSREPASIPSLYQDKTSSQLHSQSLKDFAYAKELKEYMQLKAKVFMTDEERAFRQRLISDTSFVREAGKLLKRPVDVESDEFDHQSRAMDLLFEALSSPAQGVAADVLRDVIQDAQIENEKMDMTSRRALAGVKAEVMYQWASVDPRRAQDIPTWLPGPVSRKIWDRVIEMQRNNLLESAQEMSK